MIKRESVVEFFEKVKNEGDLDVSNELLWGFFFLDSSIEKLKKVGSKLSEVGFVFVDIFQAENEDPNLGKEFYLHVEKIETHHVESLVKVNEVLYAIANEYITEYDGFDAGAIR